MEKRATIFVSDTTVTLAAIVSVTGGVSVSAGVIRDSELFTKKALPHETYAPGYHQGPLLNHLDQLYRFASEV